MQADYKVLGRVLVSNHRFRILTLLTDRMMTPTQMSRRLDLELSHVSRTLKELESLGLIECKNPEIRKGKLYATSEYGKKTLESLKRIVNEGEVNK